ncbi:MAG: UDP-N-acetylglucosamine 2-epimerase (non-hydrolyzing) [Planctomycetes bacterium]|nr:UDP-N-acetylglucosamine 2-epimerase (non-hydrolyzing) [Planctomycetota bacterium]
MAARPRIAIVVGARPNFMKAGPVLHALQAHGGFSVQLVNTGQHYDEKMAGSFLRDLGFPKPDADLGVGSGSHGRQTAQVLAQFEEWLVAHPQEMVLVVGDVNSTVAATLAAVKLAIPVAHVEAGLRSGDRLMPEELNRLATDALSSLLFVTEPAGVVNLKREGARDDRIALVGNTMIDTLQRFRAVALATPRPAGWPQRYALVTLHRPSNVDEEAPLRRILAALEEIASDLPLVWAVHPRTEKRLSDFGLHAAVANHRRIRLVPPQGYVEFMAAMARASLILTDSGGVQEEALVLKVPVVTLRENTERPVTVDCGGNTLAGNDRDRIVVSARTMLARDPAEFRVPENWDGRAAERIVLRIVRFFAEGASL